MDALKLYKFVKDNRIEYNKINEDKDVIIFVPFSLIADFTSMLGHRFLFDPLWVVLKEDCIALEMKEICERLNIEMSEVFEDLLTD